MTKQQAIEAVLSACEELQASQAASKAKQDDFAQVCRKAYDAGLNDREIAEMTGYSRARIQQYRCGDPRKKVAA